MVPEESVFLLTDLERGATELCQSVSHTSLAKMIFCTRRHLSHPSAISSNPSCPPSQPTFLLLPHPTPPPSNPPILQPSQNPPLTKAQTRKREKEQEQTHLRNQNFVASLDRHLDAAAVPVEGAGSRGDDLGLVELLDAALGQEDAAGRLGLGLDALHEDAVEEGG